MRPGAGDLPAGPEVDSVSPRTAVRRERGACMKISPPSRGPSAVGLLKGCSVPCSWY